MANTEAAVPVGRGPTISPESPFMVYAEDASDASNNQQTQPRPLKHMVRALKGAYLRDELDVLPPQDAPGSGELLGSLSIEFKSTYNCVTEAPLPAHLKTKFLRSTPKDDIQDIIIGLYGTVPRWKTPCTINFAAYANGYPTRDQAIYAATRLNEAAQDWNRHLAKIGIQFKWVGSLSDAAFVLSYGGDAGTTLARAFFPNSDDLNTLYVYQSAFSPANINYQVNIFKHELGHVLGLRHEFAPEKEGGAIVWGHRNPLSVMSYQFPPQIQQTDVTDLINFYRFQGPFISGFTVQNFVPDN